MTRILFVEDDPDIIHLVLEILQGEQWEAKAALGDRALEIAKEWPPDVILLDLLLPVYDGWTIRELLLRDPVTRDIPVIVLTAVPPILQKTENMKAASVVQKPFNVDALVMAIKEVLSFLPS